MSQIQSYNPRTGLSRPSRDLVRLAASTELAVAHVDAVAEVEQTKVHALQRIANQAMQGVALVSQTEQQLSQIVPIAASRLQAIGDIHALATADMVTQVPRRLS